MSLVRVSAFVDRIVRTLQESIEPKGQDVRRQWERGLRFAAVEPWFSVRDDVQLFERCDLKAIEGYRPQIVAASPPRLCGLAEEALRNTIRLPSLDCGVIAWTGIGRPVLKPADRDMLWLAFQVPIFEEFRSWTGELLAWECEAHAGLHIVEERAAFTRFRPEAELYVSVAADGNEIPGFLPTGLDGQVVTGACPCGKPGPRLVAVRTRTEPLVPAMAMGF